MVAGGFVLESERIRLRALRVEDAALLFGLFLVPVGQWRIVALSVPWTLGLIAASVITFGVQPWVNFIEWTVPHHAQLLSDFVLSQLKPTISPYAGARMVGLPEGDSTTTSAFTTRMPPANLSASISWPIRTSWAGSGSASTRGPASASPVRWTSRSPSAACALSGQRYRPACSNRRERARFASLEVYVDPEDPYGGAPLAWLAT